MADVVALELEARAVALADLLQDVLDVLVGVAEDEVARALERRRLPVVLPGLVALQHRVEAEVHRAHVERAHLGLGAARGGEALLEAHAVAAAGRDVDHHVRGLLDHRQKPEHLGVGRRPAVLRVARVQVHDRGTRLRRAERALGDLLRRDRQVRAHGRRVDRAGHGAADDHLVAGLPCGIRHDVHSRCVRRPRALCGERHQAAIAPGAALGQTLARQDGAPLLVTWRSRRRRSTRAARARPRSPGTRGRSGADSPMPPGAFRSMVSSGPMNDQRRPMPCLIAVSMSAAEATRPRPCAAPRRAAPPACGWRRSPGPPCSAGSAPGRPGS